MSNLITARETVTTYADGKGRWYARVDFAPGYTPDQIGRHIDRIRAKARRYIRAELIARQGAPRGAAPDVRLPRGTAGGRAETPPGQGQLTFTGNTHHQTGATP